MACSVYKWTPERRGEVEEALRASSTRAEAASRLGVALGSLDSACARYGMAPRDFLAQGGLNSPPPAGPDIQGSEAKLEYEPPPPPAILPPGKELTVSLVGDLHAPEEDKPAWSACLRWHAEHKPDVIVLNEMGEWESMTKHGGNWGAMFEEDVKAVRRRLVQIRSLCPDARVVLLETNHDTRLQRRLREVLPQLHGHLAIPQELHLDDLGIEWVSERVAFRIGRLKVIHGHQLASNAKGNVPENACKRAVQRFGEPGVTVVFFHTHRKGYWMERHDTGVFEAVNLPCLRTLAPDWTAPCPTGWQHGFGVAHIGPSGQSNLYTVDIERGSFVYGGVRYAA